MDDYVAVLNLQICELSLMKLLKFQYVAFWPAGVLNIQHLPPPLHYNLFRC